MISMATKSKLLSIVRNQIGVKESPAGSNKVKYNTWYYGKVVSGSAYPWCMAFVCWCLNEAGMMNQITKTASCGVQATYAQKTGRWHWGSKGIASGDIVIYSFSSAHDHTGIVVSVASSTIEAVEGNTSITSNDNGGNVMQRTRNRSKIYGYIRLTFDGEKGNDVIRRGQEQANKFVTKFKIAEDGERGADTRKKAVMVLQTALNKDYGAGLTVDGIIGANTKKALGTHYVKRGEKQYMVTAAEIMLMMLGKDPHGVEKPGVFGSGLEAAAGKSKITSTDFINYTK